MTHNTNSLFFRNRCRIIKNTSKISLTSVIKYLWWVLMSHFADKNSTRFTPDIFPVKTRHLSSAWPNRFRFSFVNHSFTKNYRSYDQNESLSIHAAFLPIAGRWDMGVVREQYLIILLIIILIQLIAWMTFRVPRVQTNWLLRNSIRFISSFSSSIGLY